MDTMDDKSSIYNIHLCRICQNPKKLDLVSTSNTSESDDGKSCLETLHYIFCEVIWVEDCILSLVCRTCLKRIYETAQFKQLCLESHRKREQFNNKYKELVNEPVINDTVKHSSQEIEIQEPAAQIEEFILPCNSEAIFIKTEKTDNLLEDASEEMQQPESSQISIKITAPSYLNRKRKAENISFANNDTGATKVKKIGHVPDNKMDVDARFGIKSSEIQQIVRQPKAANTIRTKSSVWSQFVTFCVNRHYELDAETTTCELNEILQDWALNMRKLNGENYKEYSVKSIWNITAKIIQERYGNEFNRSFNPFSDIEFRSARDARNAKRKQLLWHQNKRKVIDVALEQNEYNAMISSCDENCPEGLQLKFFHVASYALAWKGFDATNCLVFYFKEELDNEGVKTNRIEYNPAFTKTCYQAGNEKLENSNSRWLVPNLDHLDRCPVRLYKKLMQKRQNITTNRFFLTPNPFWQKLAGIWYKNTPVGKKEISKWLTKSVGKMGLDVQKRKISL